MANGKPLNAPAHTTGFAAWIDRRFPIASFWQTHITGYYAPQKFQLLGFLRLARLAGAGDSNRDRHFSGDELQAGRGAGFFLGRAHHARCAVGLVAPLSPFNRRVDVFRRGLSPYFPWVFIRLLSRAARTGLDIRLHDFSVPDGRGVFWLSAAVGTNVVLGRAGDH